MYIDGSVAYAKGSLKIRNGHTGEQSLCNNEMSTTIRHPTPYRTLSRRVCLVVRVSLQGHRIKSGKATCKFSGDSTCPQYPGKLFTVLSRTGTFAAPSVRFSYSPH